MAGFWVSREFPECEGSLKMPTIVPQSEFRAVFDAWSHGRLTSAAAAAELHVCERTFRRYVARFSEYGSKWWKDRLGDGTSKRRASSAELAALHKVYRDQYLGWNVRHFYERYRHEHGGERSYTWVKNALQDAGLVEKRARDVAPNGRHERAERQPPRRTPTEGMLLHQVASSRKWSAGQTWDLILMVDDASNRVHSGFFVVERGIWPVFRGIRETLERGLFECLHLDVALPTRLSSRETAFGDRTMPQVDRVMNELGIDMSRRSPAIRGRPIRTIGTIADRLPKELAREGIAEIDQANRFLSRFWTRLNETLAIMPADPCTAFVPLGVTYQEELQDVLCLKHDVRISNGHRVLCNAKEISIPEYVRRQLQVGKRFRIHEYEDGACALFRGRHRVATIEMHSVGIDVL